MSANSKIEWTDATWNPVRGCTKISPGCKNCYAETFAERFRGVPGHPYEQGFDLRLVPDKLSEPLLWRRQKMVFVNSMSDLFHEDVPDEFIVAIANTMRLANWHTYQVLTKRADRLSALLKSKLRFAAGLKHIWWGVSVENKKQGIPRCETLRRTNAAMKFLSVEPLLEELGRINLRGIDWVIVGGESGPVLARWTSVGSFQFVTNANDTPYRFSSNNGAVFARRKRGECWKIKLMMKFRFSVRRK